MRRPDCRRTDLKSGMEIQSQIYDEDLDETQRKRFNRLRIAIGRLNYRDKLACNRMCKRIQDEVTEHPILARTVKKRFSQWRPEEWFCESLLSTLCERQEHTDLVHPAIKFLVIQNSSALLWEFKSNYLTIHIIANIGTHCVLMPWIAQFYPSVLEFVDFRKKTSRRLPSYLCESVVFQYRKGACNASEVRKFFENYPRALLQDTAAKKCPLHVCLRHDPGLVECDANLFQWLAEQHPPSIHWQDEHGQTPLRRACATLLNFPTDNMVKICRYLIKNSPQSVSLKHTIPGTCRESLGLPIHILLRHCNDQAVREVLVDLLREYPESFNAPEAPGWYPAPREIPFVQQVMPLLEKEPPIQDARQDIAVLTYAYVLLRAALAINSEDQSYTNATTAFAEWARLRVDTLNRRFDETNEFCCGYEEKI